MTRTIAFAVALCLLPLLAGGEEPKTYDLILRGGTIYDGSGGKPYRGRRGDERRPHRRGRRDRGKPREGREIDARGLAVAPGFINMLSWATESLLRRRPRPERHPPGRHAGGLRRGRVDGPLNDAMKKEMVEQQGDIKYPTSPGPRSASTSSISRRAASSRNVASFVGATTVRIHVLGYADRPPNADELARMRAAGAPGHGGRRAGRRLVADLRAGLLRRDRRADRAVQGGRASTAACTSRTCAARATGCSRRSTS